MPLGEYGQFQRMRDPYRGTSHPEWHTCDTGYFDRTLCPEPCGSMHSYCDSCGRRQDPCVHDDSIGAPPCR